MSLAGGFRAWRLARPIASRVQQVQEANAEHAGWQLDRLNRLWLEQTSRVPRYRELLASGTVPTSFESWEQFVATVPPTRREDVQTRGSSLLDPSRPADHFYLTGGSSGKPVRIPAWRSEVADLALNRWMARGWFGITPATRMFLIWGHSHLLGGGVRGRINASLRNAKDRLLGYTRFSAYNLSDERAREAGEQILRERPECVVGYSSALELVARVNRDRADAFASLGLKAVIATAEVFPSREGPALVKETFGCPLAMEYGSVETTLLAHTHPDGSMRTMWNSYFLEAGEEGPGGGRVLRVTSLHPRAMPLVRYEIGDEVELVAGDQPLGLTRLSRVVGRLGSFLVLADGTRVHAEAITHCIRGRPEVARFQVLWDHNGVEIRFELLPSHLLGGAAKQEDIRTHVRERLLKVHPSLGDAKLIFDAPLVQAIAGKTPMIVARAS